MDEFNILLNAYEDLLRLPHNATRARMQGVLASLRDELAILTGRTAEEIQNETEDRVMRG